MTRFAGLPERQNTAPKLGARFSNLPEQLASMSRPENVDRIRAAAKGEAFTGRLATTKRTAAEPTKPVARPATPPAPARAVKASAPPKPLPLTIPADVAAQGPEAVAAYESGYLRAKARGEELSKHPAVAGRSAEAMKMFREGKTNAEIIAALTADRQASASDEIWARARASVDGSGAAPAAPTIAAEPATPDHKPSAAEAKADAVWAKARASIDSHRAIAR